MHLCSGLIWEWDERLFVPQANYTCLCSRRTHRLQFPLFQESHRGGFWRALESAEESEASEPEEVEQTDRAKRDSGASSLKSIESRPACYSDSSVKDSHRLCLCSESFSGPLTAFSNPRWQYRLLCALNILCV